MKRARVLVLVIVLTMLLGGATACSSASSLTNAASSAGHSAANAVNQSASPTSGTCASAGTRKLPKTRLLADLALTYGAFHRYLYNPYRAGAFHKGAHGRIKATIKAGLATALIIKLLDNASKNAAADPTLCKFVPNMESIKASLTNLVDKIKGGDANSSDAESAKSAFDQLKSGTGFSGSSNGSLPGLG